MKKIKNTVLLLLVSIMVSAQISKEDREWLIKKTLTDLVFVKGGTFMLGDVGYTDSTGVHRYFANKGSGLPVHEVTLDSYLIGKLEVTFKEFDLFCKDTGKELVGKRQRHPQFRSVFPELSAIWLDWHQAMDYCKWLSKLTGLPFNLTTNAQWEYAARSRGQAVKYATDNGLMDKGRNYKSEHYNYFTCPPPGSYPPNPLGIYDMSGGKPEWVRDAYAPYTKWPKENPVMDFQERILTVRGFYPVIYGRGYRNHDQTGSGVCIRFVVNQQEPVDVEAVLQRLGIEPPTAEEIEQFMPKNWVEKGKYCP